MVWEVYSNLRPILINAVIEENGVRLRLNIVDTPGYGDQVNNDRWYGAQQAIKCNWLTG